MYPDPLFDDLNSLLFSRLSKSEFAIKVNQIPASSWKQYLEPGKKHFRTLTGKDVPSTIYFKEDTKGGRTGYHWAKTRWGCAAVSIEKTSAPGTFSTTMHELGHVACQQLESIAYTSHNGSQKYKVMDEACAQTFAWASAWLLGAKQRKAMLAHIRNTTNYYISLYARGSNDEHAEGYDIADAAVTVLQSESEAFNYLSTIPYKKLSPEIRNLVTRIVHTLLGFERLKIEVSVQRFAGVRNYFQEVMKKAPD